MNNNSRLRYLACLAFAGMLVGLWLAARDGDLLAIGVLVALSVLLLVGIGVTVAVLIMYATTRMAQASFNSNAAENAQVVAQTQRTMAQAMAVQGRAFSQLPAGGALPMLPGPSLELPALTGFQATEASDDQETY